MKDLLEEFDIRVKRNSVEYVNSVHSRRDIEKYCEREYGLCEIERLGWRYLLQRMDEFEANEKETSEHKSETESRCPKCGSANPLFRGVVQFNPMTSGTCGDAWHSEQHGEQKPTWEPGTVIVLAASDGSFPYRLDRLSGPAFDGEDWDAVRLSDGLKVSFHVKPKEWRVHRLPHQFKAGDWFEFYERGRWHGPYKCKEHRKEEGVEVLYWEYTDAPVGRGNTVGADRCRHVPPPKDEPKRCLVTGNPCGTDTWSEGCPCQCENCRSELAGCGSYPTTDNEHSKPLMGPHWNAQMNYGNLVACVNDLRDFVLKLEKEKK